MERRGGGFEGLACRCSLAVEPVGESQGWMRGDGARCDRSSHSRCACCMRPRLLQLCICGLGLVLRGCLISFLVQPLFRNFCIVGTHDFPQLPTKHSVHTLGACEGRIGHHQHYVQAPCRQRICSRAWHLTDPPRDHAGSLRSRLDGQRVLLYSSRIITFSGHQHLTAQDTHHPGNNVNASLPGVGMSDQGLTTV